MQRTIDGLLYDPVGITTLDVLSPLQRASRLTATVCVQVEWEAIYPYRPSMLVSCTVFSAKSIDWRHAEPAF